MSRARSAIGGGIAGIAVLSLLLLLLEVETRSAIGVFAAIARFARFPNDVAVGVVIFLAAGIAAWPLLFVAVEPRIPLSDDATRGMAFSMFAASYYWFPMIVGRWYDRRLALVHFTLSLVGVVVTFTPLLILGYLGLPRRFATYPEQFALLQQVATAGAFVIGTGVVVWLVNVVQSIRVGEPVTADDPWDLAETRQLSPEWVWFTRRRNGEE